MNNDQLDIIIKAQNLASSELRSVLDQLEKLDNNSTSANKSFGVMTAAVAAGSAVWDIAKNSIRGIGDAVVGFVENAADVQMLRTSMDTLTGSAQQGKEMFSSLYKMAAETPFETTDLASATQVMLGFGIAQKDILPDLKTLGDVSMGNKDKLQGLALVFSQVQSQGKLMGQDLLQMINNGFNPLNEISRTTGKSMSILKDEMSKGEISANMISDAFNTATQQGGLFYGGMDKGSKTLNGTWSTLQDGIGMITRKMIGLSDTGEVVQGGLFDKITKGVNIMNDWITKNQDTVNKWAADFQKVVTDTWHAMKDFIGGVIDFSKWVISNKDWLLPIIKGLAAVKAAFMLKSAFDIVTGLFNTFTLETIPKADLALSTFVANNIIAPVKIVAAWAVGNAKVAASWALESGKILLDNSKVVLDSIVSAGKVAIPWIANAIKVSTVWTITEMPKLLISFAGTAAKAVLHAADTSLAWVLNAVRVSLVWTITEMPKLVASFIVTSASAVKEAAISSVSWVKNAAISSYAWVTTELPKIIASFAITSGSSIKESLIASAAWVKNAIISSTAWVVTELPKIIAGFVTTSASAVAEAIVASGAWIASAAQSSFAWVVTELPKIIAAFIAMSASAVVQSALTTTAWVTSAVTATESFQALSALLATPLAMPAIVVTAALFAISQVVSAYNDMQTAINGAKKAQETMYVTKESAAAEMLSIYNNGVSSPASKLAAKQGLHNLGMSGFSNGGFTGTGSVNEPAGIVHKGEYVVPKNQVDQSTGKPKIGSIGGMVINNYNTFNRDSDPIAFARQLGFQLTRAS